MWYTIYNNKTYLYCKQTYPQILLVPLQIVNYSDTFFFYSKTKIYQRVFNTEMKTFKKYILYGKILKAICLTIPSYIVQNLSSM